ncbi:hypothetical protein [Pseudomonas asiatica]|uniref:COG4315 family predicted lipoprotein n=1 Tax=Pseudomonas asiatica TaxID=2219225 RepID=UPI0018AA4DD2|nr:hypothetical protein [Pseudomonas asiatica]MBF8804052.1 hypothetical protein [Pseudomonas asiatica]
MTRQTLSWMALFTALALPGVALADHAMEKGGMLVDHAGMTLYTFDKDAGGKSMCNGECAKNWPPLMVQANDEPAKDKWTVVMRDDGSKQWAYDGKPLYTFINHKTAGHIPVDAMKEVCHVPNP